MKRILFPIVFIISTFVANHLSAQITPFSKLSIGAGLSTYGVRLEASTSVTPFINLRGGFSYLPFSYKNSFTIDADEYRKYIDYNPDLSVKADLNMFHAHVLGDFSFVPNGIFHVTTGLFFGKSKIEAYGVMLNPSNARPTVDDLRANGYVGDEIPELEFDNGYTIQPDKDGGINSNIQLGKTVKPYFGIGVGRTIPKHKVSVKLDLGVVYQGELDFSSPNMTKGSFNDLIRNESDFKKYEPYTKWYPMLNLQLSYRIF